MILLYYDYDNTNKDILRLHNDKRGDENNSNTVLAEKHEASTKIIRSRSDV